MNFTVKELDGRYIIESRTSAGGPFSADGDGETEIKNGWTYRKDKNGCIWESSFTIIGENKVRMETTLDPSHAAAPKYILDDHGNPTTAFVKYKTVLTVSQENGQFVLQGTLEHAGQKTSLKMTQIKGTL